VRGKMLGGGRLRDDKVGRGGLRTVGRLGVDTM